MSERQERRIIGMIQKASVWFVGISALVIGLIALAIAMTAAEGRNTLIRLSLAVIVAGISLILARECRRMSA